MTTGAVVSAVAQIGQMRHKRTVWRYSEAPTPNGLQKKCPITHSTTGEKVSFCPWYYFAPDITSIPLSYTKMAKIVAIRSVFATKNSPKCFVAPGFFTHSAGEGNTLPFSTILDANLKGLWRLDSRCLDSLHATPVLIIKSRRLWPYLHHHEYVHLNDNRSAIRRLSWFS